MKQLIKLMQCLSFLLALLSTANAETITIASNRKADYNIVCSKTASTTEKFACEELKKYLNQISNANFKVSFQASKKSIVVCVANALPQFAKDLNIPTLTNEDYGIFKRGETIYLVGGVQEAVLFSVYDFLEELGCRWFAPDFKFYEGTNQYIPVKKNLGFTYARDKIESTSSKYRKFYATGGALKYEELMALIDWMPKLKFNILAFKMVGELRWDLWREKLTAEIKKRGILIEDGGHGYDYFIGPDMESGTLFEKHPEWFGMNKKMGINEKGFRSKEKRVIFCTSNKDAVTYLHKNLLGYLKLHPEVDIFDFWPPDQEIWCECPNCLALGSPSDRHATLVSETAKFLQKELPALKMECLAYHFYFEPPQNAKLPDNVLIDFADYYQNFEYQFYQNENPVNKKHNDALVKWTEQFKGDISIYSYYRKGFWRSLPNIMPHYIQNDLKYYKSIGIKGVSVYSEPNDWFTYGINHYALGKLAWNPDTNIDSIESEYCSKVYGTAGNVAKFVYNEFEDVVRFACVIHQTSFKTNEQYDQYSARMNACIKKITVAEKQFGSNSTVKNHLFRLRLMTEYAAKSIEMMRNLAVKELAKDTKQNPADNDFDNIKGVLTRRPPLEDDLKNWLKKYNHLGIFAAVDK